MKAWNLLWIVPTVIFVATYLVMLLWNAIMPPVFNINQVNYWQMLGILFLARVLFYNP